MAGLNQHRPRSSLAAATDEATRSTDEGQRLELRTRSRGQEMMVEIEHCDQSTASNP